jgi:hypothetical protein
MSGARPEGPQRPARGEAAGWLGRKKDQGVYDSLRGMRPELPDIKIRHNIYYAKREFYLKIVDSFRKPQMIRTLYTYGGIIVEN